VRPLSGPQTRDDRQTRGSHFYLALIGPVPSPRRPRILELKAIFTPIAAQLTTNEAKIVAELAAVQGKPIEVGGYYLPDDAKAAAALRPSATFNAIWEACKREAPPPACPRALRPAGMAATGIAMITNLPTAGWSRSDRFRNRWL